MSLPAQAGEANEYIFLNPLTQNAIVLHWKYLHPYDNVTLWLR